MAAPKMDVRDILAKNLEILMAERPELSSTPAIERATAMKGHKVGKSTIDRVQKSDAPFNLDSLQAVAKVFGVAVHQLLQPNLGRTSVAEPPLDWPFEDVKFERWDRLRPRQKGVVEDAMNTALDRIEAAGGQQANSGQA